MGFSRRRQTVLYKQFVILPFCLALLGALGACATYRYENVELAPYQRIDSQAEDSMTIISERAESRVLIRPADEFLEDYGIAFDIVVLNRGRSRITFGPSSISAKQESTNLAVMSSAELREAISSDTQTTALLGVMTSIVGLAAGVRAGIDPMIATQLFTDGVSTALKGSIDDSSAMLDQVHKNVLTEQPVDPLGIAGGAFFVKDADESKPLRITVTVGADQHVFTFK